MSSRFVIDLTLDSSDNEDAGEASSTIPNTPSLVRSPTESPRKIKIAMTAQKLTACEEELASQTERIASMELTKESKSPERSKLDLSSPEVLALSPFRNVKRLPDIIYAEQKIGLNKATHRVIMEADIQYNSPGSPDILIENEVDKQWAPPYNFIYINDYLLDTNMRPDHTQKNDYLTVKKGCSCRDGFCDAKTCDCRKIHSKLAPDYYQNFPQDQFAYKSDGLLHKEILEQEDTPIWECNKDCTCAGDCENYVVSKKRKVGLTIFKHAKKGWCVKLAEDVKAGQFIETYTGELITAADANKRNLVYSKLNNTYVMDLTPFHVKWHVHAMPYLRKTGQTKDQYVEKKLRERNFKGTIEERLNERSNILDELVEEEEKKCEDDKLLSIDGTLFGNVTRYLAHSCEPNLVRHMVYTYERDIRRPLVAYFASKDIKAGEEITMHYEGLSDHNFEGPHSAQMSEFVERLENMKCYCGTPSCSQLVFGGRREQAAKTRM
ncbi:SET domain-containing protein [Meira miltonrushii]|uniref:SET domain-containing protein n=1 Tax=Meira miltonrushii TaxID=1280837 RepID=A0A316VBD3_9BASI|nr:SET domain-containing protein [Meira miltonrushii]PWN34852.1 SET domain-containing protein [Meira miltonrushii]